jgi:hypothetical protein
MTAEVVLMNKQAVAMAADSAGTTGRKKILNSHNKLFMLSKRHPIGIMIYGSSEIMGYPWEAVIKMYRKSLGEKKFPTLGEQAEHFKDYLRKSNLFNARAEELYINNTFNSVMNSIFDDIRKLKGMFQDQETIEKEHLAVYITQVISFRKQNSEYEVIKCDLSEEDKDNILKKYKDSFCKAIIENFNHSGIDQDIIQSDVLSITRNAIFRNPETYLGSSGVVLSGFGDDEFFPSTISFRVSSIINENIMMCEHEEFLINLDERAQILPFAQRDMVESIVYGIDPRLKEEIEKGISDAFVKIPEAIVAATQLSQEQKNILRNSLNEVFETTTDVFFENIENYTRKNHIYPILRGVSALPPEDLAMMAETLVSLTSFKRKISDNQLETVGGPVDVAIITKGDGFVWIKKKYYFQADKNHHFFSNYYYGEAEDDAK